ncbi:MAG: hypothetical protein AAF658_20155, partial [Myxococcota bacterium]
MLNFNRRLLAWVWVLALVTGCSGSDDTSETPTADAVDGPNEVQEDLTELETEAVVRRVAFDSEEELRGVLDDDYLPSSYLPSWDMLTDIPADLADGDDNTEYTA